MYISLQFNVIASSSLLFLDKPRIVVGDIFVTGEKKEKTITPASTPGLPAMIVRRMSHDNNKRAVNQLPLSFACAIRPPGGATGNYNFVFTTSESSGKHINNGTPMVYYLCFLEPSRRPWTGNYYVLLYVRDYCRVMYM